MRLSKEMAGHTSLPSEIQTRIFGAQATAKGVSLKHACPKLPSATGRQNPSADLTAKMLPAANA